MSKRLYYRPLFCGPLLNSVFAVIGMQIKQTMARKRIIYLTGKLQPSSTSPQQCLRTITLPEKVTLTN